MFFMLFFACEDKPKDSKFTFIIKVIGCFTIDAKNNKYTVHTSRGDTSTTLELSDIELDSIRHLFLSKKLFQVSKKFHPNCSETEDKIVHTIAKFEYNSLIYEFVIPDCESYFFNKLKIRKVNDFVLDIHNMILKKDNIKHMPKSDLIWL